MKNFFRRTERDTDASLADVNEQELAKDTAEREEKREEETVKTSEDALPVKAERGLPVPACGEDKADVESETEREREESAEVTESNLKVRARGGVICTLTCLTCLIAALAMLYNVLTLKVIPEPDEPQAEAPVDDGKDYTQTGSTPALYETCAVSAVTVLATGDDGTVCSSGFAAFEGGYIAAAYECVADARTLFVRLSTGQTVRAEYLCGDESVGLALLKTEVDLPAVTLAKQGADVGERVYAIGAVGSAEMSASLCSADVCHTERVLARTLSDGSKVKTDVIQLSPLPDITMLGAAVFAQNGEAVAVVIGCEGAATLAIPSGAVGAVLEELYENGKLSAPTLDEYARAVARLGIFGENALDGGGVSIVSFADGECSAAQMLRAGDVIVGVNDTRVTDTENLAEILDAFSPLDTVEVFVSRGGSELSFFVTLEK